jgi:hypothetical protein
VFEEIIIRIRERISSGDHAGALDELAREGVNLLATIDEAKQAVDAYIQAAQAAISELQAAAAASDAQPIIDDVAAATAALPQPPAP